MTTFLDLKKTSDTVSVPILVKSWNLSGFAECLYAFSKIISKTGSRGLVWDSTLVKTQVRHTLSHKEAYWDLHFFLIYVNDLCNKNVANVQVFPYADDTAVVFTGDTWHDEKLVLK